jgi:hypothetical protein
MADPAIDNRPPEPEELPALAGDVSYEMEQFFHSQRRVIELEAELHRVNMDRNSQVEALLIHSRCLMDFFACKPQKDDVVATHYVPTWDPETDGGPELAWLEATLGTYVDKRVAHLTAYRQRVDRDTEAQLVTRVAQAMATIISRFMALGPEPWRS